MKKFLVVFFLLLIGHSGHSQLNNSLLASSNTDSLFGNKVKLGFFIDNVNYLRNTEYHSVIEHGATWAGAQIWPQIYYRYNAHLTFKAGVFVQKDLGNNNFRTLIPTYTLTYTKKNLKVNFGTLDGSLDHHLIEPLYANEHFIDKRIENGLQFKGKTKWLKYDAWIDWEKMIYRNSNFPEMFTTGVSTKLRLVKKEDFKINIPFQMVLRHQGGEIYQGPHSNIKTQVNMAYGLQVIKEMPQKAIDKIDFQAFYTVYEDLAPSKADSFFDGTGTYISLALHKKNAGLMLNYWDAHQFVSPLGEPLYVSKSRIRETDYLQYRKMLMLRFMYEVKVWENFSLVARLNNIYDLSEKEFNNVVEVYTKFNIGWH